MNYDTPTAYSDLGWPVVPLHTPERGGCSCQQPDCDHIGKHPRVRGWQRCASTEHDMIMRWWGNWPNANIGIVTGRRSGLLVLDVENYGYETLNDYPTLPATPIAQSGSGGRHYYYKHPDVVLKNECKFLHGLDIRTDGGLIVAPPSLHQIGQRYRWLMSPDKTPLADCPQWVIEAVLAKMHEEAEATRSSGFAVPGHALTRGGQPYAIAVLEREAEAVRTSTNGSRNNQLNRAAYAVGRIIEAGQLDEQDVFNLLVEAGIAAGLPAAEARTTARSGLRAGMQKPREIAPPRRPGGDDDPPGPPALPDDAHNTDLGNAARFAAQHGPQLRYVPKWDSWLQWDGTRWQRDETRAVYRLARETIKHMYIEAGQIEDEKERKKQAQWAIASESKARIEAMIALAQSEGGIPVTPDQLDAEQYVINCTNGTVDLRTGKLRPHQTDDLITKRIDVAYHPEATCPTWKAFLGRILQDDAELITYVQRCIGYTLTGSTQEQCLFFAYGTGRNGKSTFFETLLALMGEYGQKAPTELIMARAPNTASNDIARLAGARLVVTAEIEEGRRLSESLVKDLTGGDTMVARFLYQELFEFTATHKLWVYGNHKPEVRGTDPGIWRRIRVIPFAVQIPAAEVDPLLKLKLLAELPGILAWAVRGCLDHQAHGLPEPEAVKQATQAYRTEMDVLAAFMRDCCVTNTSAQAPVKELYRAYKQWCEDNGERAVTQRRLALQLQERGFDLYRSNGTWYRLGLGLLAEEDRYGESSDPSDPNTPVFMTFPHESNFHESHEKADLGSLGSLTEEQTPEDHPNDEGLPPLGREEERSGATIETGFTAVRLPAEQWQAAKEAWRTSNMRALYAIARACRVPFQALVDALGGNSGGI